MEELINFFTVTIGQNIISILIAIAIIILFKLCSSPIAYVIIKIFKLKEKSNKNIKKSAFYLPIRVVISILGIYVAVLYLEEPLKISQDIMNIVKVIFQVVSIIAFTNGVAKSFKPGSTLVNTIRKKMKKDENDLMFEFVIKIARAVIYIIGFIVLIVVLGFDVTTLVAGLGLSGVIITLAAQDTAKSLLGGTMIFLDKPFGVGDWIQLEGYEGLVEDITFRSTRIRTFENAIVNIPNANVSNTSITNWSKMEKRRYKTNLCVEMDMSLERLEDFKVTIEQRLRERKTIIDDSIIVRFDVIKENGINILIYSFMESIDYVSYLKEKEEVNYMIMKTLNEKNIKLAYDTKTIILNDKNKV